VQAEGGASQHHVEQYSDAQCPSLASTSYTVNTPIWNLASGDFNGDGKPDLVLLSPDFQGNQPWGIEIMFGDGNGGFAAPVHVSELAPAPAGIAVADFNRDGRADLAIAGYGSGLPPTSQINVQLLLGANVQPPASIAVLAGSPQSISDGSAFNPPLQAIVSDSNGNPVSNVLVTFSNSALPSPTAALAVTDSKGIANMTGPFLFSSTGVQTIVATVQGVPGQASFLVTILPEDVTSSVLAVSNGFLYSRVSQTYSGSLQISANYYPYGFWAPIEVVLTGLPPGVTLMNAAGTYNGYPYFILGSYAIQYSVPLVFSGPPGATIQFTPIFYMGALQ
jgi:hypothetical protein